MESKFRAYVVLQPPAYHIIQNKSKENLLYIDYKTLNNNNNNNTNVVLKLPSHIPL